jgi:tol-pal system protein YbgF
MRSMLFSPVLIVLLLVVSGCATVAPQQEGAMRGASQMGNGQAELALEVQRLRDSVLVLEGRLREQQHLTEELRRTIVAQNVTSLGDKAAILAPASPDAPPQAGNSVAGSPTDIYLHAFANYASGRFEQASQGFENFLRLFPGSEQAGNARYWLGECYYALGRYPQAVDEFRKISEQDPQGSKTPDALLKMASALEQIEQPEEARRTLQILRDRYPASSAARTSMEKR